MNPTTHPIVLLTTFRTSPQPERCSQPASRPPSLQAGVGVAESFGDDLDRCAGGDEVIAGRRVGKERPAPSDGDVGVFDVGDGGLCLLEWLGLGPQEALS